MTAAAQDQWRLLDLQAVDTTLTQLGARHRTVSAAQPLAQARAALDTAEADLAEAVTEAADLRRQVARAEADVEQVRQRAARNQSRLDAGQGSAKELQGMQHELETLAARQSVLEDAELELMEQQEALDAKVAALTQARDDAAAQVASLETGLQADLTQLENDQAAARAEREQVAAGVPAELLAVYERIRSSSSGHGIGAARLFQGRCEGCNIQLTTNDLQRVKAAAPTEVVRCEDCGRILVRTADSGL